MAEKEIPSGWRPNVLRRRAEGIARKKTASIPEGRGALSPEDTRRLLHELQVHQIELEMQNDELRSAQAQLDSARSRYFDLYDLAPVGYCILSVQGLILETNLAAATLLGVTRGALVKQPITRFIRKEDQDIYYRHCKHLSETGVPQACELRMVKMDGEAFWGHLAIAAMQANDYTDVSRVVLTDITGRKEAEAALGRVHDELEQRVKERTEALRQANEELRMDIINRKRAEEMLHRTEENFRRSLEDSPLGIRIVNKEGETIYANQAILDIYGYDSVEELGRTPFENHHTTRGYAESKTRKNKKKSDHGRTEYEISIVRKDGAVRHLQVLCKEILWDDEGQFQVIYQDITERSRADRELIETLQQLQETKDKLIQFEKHEAIGRLAAGVAHEIFNPASIISSRLQFLEQEDLSAAVRENVRISREQLQRIVKISRDLLQSSSKKPRVPVDGDLRQAIEVGLQMTERRTKEDHILVKCNPLPEIIPVKMEMDGMVRVMVNLILNACDAMTDKQIRRLIITVHHLKESAKKYSVILTVADNGQGIPAVNLTRIFDPFFTTKAPGKGTGLGLSVCKGIIEEHGGTIRAENNKMGGASFVVELPTFYP
jgi:PAS domain S-box-containing protein